MLTTDLARNILVTGSHKSGSTWVGRVLSASGEPRYYHEPLNLKNECKFKTPMKYWFEYIGGDPGKKLAIRQYIDYITRGGFRIMLDRLNREGPGNTKNILAEELVKIRDRRQRILLKDPLAVFSADFFYEDLGYDVLVVIRHPAAFAESLKTKRWYHDFNHFTAQERLMTEVLIPFQDDVANFIASPRRKGDIIEHAILLWNLIHHRILQYRSAYDDWLFVRHEDLSRDPYREFERICHRFDIEFGDQIRNYLTRTTKGEGITGPNRDMQDNMSKWTSRLSSEEINRIHEGTRAIADVFYDESEWFGLAGAQG